MEDIIDIIYKWVQVIENLIARHTIVKPIIGERGGEVSKGWIFELIFRLGISNQTGKKGDGVMGFAYWTGLMLLSWYFRTHFAKTCDPRRSKEKREYSVHQLAESMLPLLEMMKLEITEKDKAIFDQEWEPIEIK